MKKKIIIVCILFIVVIISLFGLDNILGLSKEEKVLKHKIICKDSVYIVNNDQYEIRYKGYANKILIVEYKNKIINCGVDYIIKDIWVGKIKEDYYER